MLTMYTSCIGVLGVKHGTFKSALFLFSAIRNLDLINQPDYIGIYYLKIGSMEG